MSSIKKILKPHEFKTVKNCKAIKSAVSKNKNKLPVTKKLSCCQMTRSKSYLLTCKMAVFCFHSRLRIHKRNFYKQFCNIVQWFPKENQYCLKFKAYLLRQDQSQQFKSRLTEMGVYTKWYPTFWGLVLPGCHHPSNCPLPHVHTIPLIWHSLNAA